MLENLHKCHHHQELDFLRSQVQQRFLVLRLRRMHRKVEGECLVCNKRKAQALTPMLAALPEERLALQSSSSTTSVFCPLKCNVHLEYVGHSSLHAWPNALYIWKSSPPGTLALVWWALGDSLLVVVPYQWYGRITALTPWVRRKSFVLVFNVGIKKRLR